MYPFVQGRAGGRALLQGCGERVGRRPGGTWLGEGPWRWRAQLSGPTLIDLIGAAPRGRRNARWPGFSRRGEARRRRPGPGQIINVN